MPPIVRLPVGTLAAFAGPSLPLAALYFPVYVFLAEFYAAERDLSLGFIGAALILVRLFDAVSDPAMGVISDKVKTRWGRRRIWLVFGAPLVMLGAWCLFAPPASAGALWFVGFLFLLTLGWTIMLTPYFAWAAELSGNYTERARVAIWRDTTGLVGTILAAVLYNAGADKAGGMMLIAAMIVILLPVSVAVCVWRVPEPKDYSRKTTAKPEAFLRVLRREPLFLRLLFAYLINGAANALPATLFLFFVGDRLGAAEWGGPLLVVYFGAAVLGAPFWSWAVRYMPKHRVWCFAMIYACFVFGAALLLREGDVGWFAVICVLSGLALGADLALPSALQADLVDFDTARNGQQRTGAFFALWSLATKASLAITGGLALIILGVIGFETGEANDAGVLTSLSFLYALAPIVLKLVAVAMMWQFPLDRAAQEKLRAEIEAT